MEINKNLCQPPEYTPDIIKDIYKQEIARALRINTILDILDDDYDLDHLRELVEADRDGRCVMLQVKPGEKVRPKQSPYRKPEIVDCVTIYTGGKITYGFHEIGMRNEWVDRWEEEEAEAYIPDKAALKGEQNG